MGDSMNNDTLVSQLQANEQQMTATPENPCIIIARTFDLLSTTSCQRTDHDCASVYVYCLCKLESALLSIQECPETREKTVAIDTILEAMNHHPLSNAVQTQALMALQHLADSSNLSSTRTGDKAGDKTVQDDIVAAIFSTMGSFLHDASLQWLGLDLLRRFQHPGSGCSDGWKSGTSLILEATKRFEEIKNIRDIALSLLAWLMCGDAACRQVLIDHGGVVHIPSMMSKYPEDDTLQGNGASILSWLLHVGGTNGRLPSLDQSFMGVFIQALSRHINYPAVVVNIVCLLTGLGMSQTENDEAYQVVIECMKRNTTTARVQECCLRFIRSRFIGMTTTAGTTTISRQVSASTGGGSVVNTVLPLVLLSMRDHPDDTHIQAEACDLLTMIITDETSRQECLSRDDAAVDLVLSALQRMQQNPRHNTDTDSRIQDGAMSFLTLMVDSTSSGRRAASSAFGGGMRVIESIQRYLDMTLVADDNEDDEDDAMAVDDGDGDNHNDNGDDIINDNNAGDDDDEVDTLQTASS